ncbi:hypothetical protein HK097_007104, partial [Rhizophlyctis rosea]
MLWYAVGKYCGDLEGEFFVSGILPEIMDAGSCFLMYVTGGEPLSAFELEGLGRLWEFLEDFLRRMKGREEGRVLRKLVPEGMKVRDLKKGLERLRRGLDGRGGERVRIRIAAKASKKHGEDEESGVKEEGGGDAKVENGEDGSKHDVESDSEDGNEASDDDFEPTQDDDEFGDAG